MLLTASTESKKFINRYTKSKEIFVLQERPDSMKLSTNKKILFWQLHCGHFHIHFCNNFPIGYNSDSVLTM